MIHTLTQPAASRMSLRGFAHALSDECRKFAEQEVDSRRDDMVTELVEMAVGGHGPRASLADIRSAETIRERIDALAGELGIDVE